MEATVSGHSGDILPLSFSSVNLRGVKFLHIAPLKNLIHWQNNILYDLIKSLSSLIVNWLSTCPYNSNLYWTDWNRDAPKIETSYMDGSNRRVLVKDDLGLPNGLTYDPQSSMLCWADAGTVAFRQMTHVWNYVCLVISSNFSPAGTHKMECTHPARGDHRQVMEGIQYPFGITSFGKNIYYTDWRRLEFLYFTIQWQHVEVLQSSNEFKSWHAVCCLFNTNIINGLKEIGKSFIFYNTLECRASKT